MIRKYLGMAAILAEVIVVFALTWALLCGLIYGLAWFWAIVMTGV
jgi:hypothetical protein